MDLNGDGHIDLISGSWPGEIFFFRGGPGRTFAAPEMLKDKEGEYINIGGGIREEPNGDILITGHGEFETTEEGTVVTYHGKRIECTDDRQISVTGTASAVHAVDWDGDGDLDLLIGDIGGYVYCVPNEGTRTEPAFGKERGLMSGFQPVRVAGDAGPFTADWDGDGDLDLLVGAGGGSVWVYRNVGRGLSLAEPVQLVPPGKVEHGPDAPREPTRGTRSKVCAADWNGDGRLDLLVGDYATQKPDLPEPTTEEKAEHDRLREELDRTYEVYGALIEKLHGRARLSDEAERKKAEAEFEVVMAKIQEIRSKIPAEYESHGWIWLFLRKPAEA